MNTGKQVGIRDLILNKRGDRSMEALSRACGGTPTRANLNRLVNEPVRSWPKDNDVITGLAKGLQVPVIDILSAYALSLGLPVESDASILKLKGAGELPEASQQVLVNTAENMLWWQEQARNARESNDSNVIEGRFSTSDYTTMAASRGDETEPRIDPEQLPEG